MTAGGVQGTGPDDATADLLRRLQEATPGRHVGSGDDASYVVHDHTALCHEAAAALAASGPVEDGRPEAEAEVARLLEGMRPNTSPESMVAVEKVLRATYDAMAHPDEVLAHNLAAIREAESRALAPVVDGGGHDQPADEAWSRLEFAAATVGDQVDRNGGAALRDWFALLAEVRSVLSGRAAEGSSDRAPTAAEGLIRKVIAASGGLYEAHDGDVFFGTDYATTAALTTDEADLVRRLVSAPQGDDVGAEGEEGER